MRSNDEIWQVGSAGTQRHDIVSPSFCLFFFLEKSLIMASGGAFKQRCRPLTRLQSPELTRTAQ